MEDGIRQLPNNGSHLVSTTVRLIVCCAFAALVTACGGGGGSSSGSSPAQGGGTPPPSNGSSPGNGSGGNGGTTNPPAVAAPTITSQPQPKRVAGGEKAAFSVTATSEVAATYQWRKNGVNIDGATDAAYVTPDVTLADNGNTYSVVVTNSGGSATSSDATLSAFANPEGVFKGTLTPDGGGSTKSLFGFVLRDGTASFFVKTGEFAPFVPIGESYHIASIAPDLDAFQTTYDAYTQVGATFSNGANELAGQMAGTVNAGVKLNGTYSTSVDHGAFNIEYDGDQYEQAASGATIAGTYHFAQVFNNAPVSGTLAFAADGSWTGSDSQSCTLVGTYSIPDPTRNVYSLTNDETCPHGTFRFTGLQTFFPAGSGAEYNDGTAFTTDTLVMLVDDGGSGYMVIAQK